MPRRWLDRDAHRVDHRADIYSLGCTLYYLLTGKEPFPEETVLKRLVAHMERAAPSLRAARADVPPALDAAYQRLMAKPPADRPASMTEVIALLETAKTTPVTVPATAHARPGSKPDLLIFDEARLKRAGTAKANDDPLIFAPPKEAEVLRVFAELSLEDLVMDVRPGPPRFPARYARRPSPA